MDKNFTLARSAMETLLLLLSAAQASAHRLAHRERASHGVFARELAEPVDARVRNVAESLRSAIEGSANVLGHGDAPASPDQVKRAFGLCLLAGFIAPALTTRKALFAGEPRESQLPEAAGSHERVAYLDAWRTLCIACVVIAHGNESYHDYNSLGVQQWVLQIIGLVSGTCFARSHSTLAGYCSRLLFIWSVGSSLNWVALIYTNGSWWERPFFTISFQMGFVFILCAGALVSTPIKHQLLSDGGVAGAATLCSWICYAVALVTALALWLFLPLVAPPWASEQMPRLALESACVQLLVAVGAHALPPRTRGLLGWVMLLCIYGFRIARSEPRPGSEIHLLDLYSWSVFVQLRPLAGQVATGMAMARWWPLWVLACGLLVRPGSAVELGQHPPGEMLERLRFYAVEVIFVLAFTTIPSAGVGHTLPIPDSVKKHLFWLNIWSLFAFCCHKAVLTLLPAWPWGTLVVFAPATAAVLATASMQHPPSGRCLRTV